MERSDEELIAAYCGGDEEAFAELVERHLRGVYSFVYRLVGESHEAEDISQETFLKAWRNIKRYRADTSKFKTWILRIARNTAIDHLRKKKHLTFSDFENEDGQSVFEETIADPGELPEELFAKGEDVAMLTRALATLSSKHREILLLHYTNHLTFEEIAVIVGEPHNTVKSRHHRAVLALRKLLAPKKEQ